MKLALFLPMIALLFFSCKKDETDFPPVQSTVAEFTKHEPGNWWVYETYKIDSLGNVTFVKNDSSYVIADSVIGSDTFSHVHLFSALYYDVFLRDSAGFLVTSEGEQLLSTSIVNDTFDVDVDVNGYYTNYQTVSLSDQPVTVPAGTFDDLLYVTDYIHLNAPLDTSYNPIIQYSIYQRNVGKVIEQYIYASAPYLIFERRLVSYHVN